jgi:3'-phosphoadenosine 5'-phosphosulfate (PAPS) 3'-phosphatase
MIALSINGRPEFGLVYAPVPKIYYWAEKNGGAWKEDAEGNITKIHVNSTSSIENIKLVVSPSYTGLRPKDTFVSSALIVGEYIKIASGGLKSGAVAEGLADAVIWSEETNTGKWDFCASDIILHEAGGSFTDLKGNLVDYSAPAGSFPSEFLGSNLRLHDSLLRSYKDYRKQI